jgi:hypothetical protein
MKTTTDPFPFPDDDLVEQNPEPLEFYKAKWTCTNCGTVNQDEIEKGTRIDEVDLECLNCGCY